RPDARRRGTPARPPGRAGRPRPASAEPCRPRVGGDTARGPAVRRLPPRRCASRRSIGGRPRGGKALLQLLPGRYSRPRMGRLWGYLARYRIRYLAGIVCLVAATSLTMTVPWLFRDAVNTLSIGGREA